MANLLHPLCNLLQATKTWKWSPECAKAFKAAKDKIISTGVLTHYDPTLPITLAADASAYGVGAVISHVFSDNSICPIALPHVP